MTAPAIQSSDVCIIVITFHPDENLAARLREFSRQAGKIVVVDDGSDATEVRMLQTIARDAQIDLTLNEGNFGQARALNAGIRRAAELGFGYVVLLDQDSRIDGEMVRALCRIYADFEYPDRLAVIGAGFRDINAAAPAVDGAASQGVAWERTECVITSGSFLPLAAYAAIGQFRDDYFIDYVDTEYCLRAKAKGYVVIQSVRPLMSHSIGAPTEHQVLWARKLTTNHSPDRRYYMARNTTVLLREYGNYRFGGWALKGFIRAFRLCKRVMLYERMKGKKVQAVLEGWWDGVRGRMGRRPTRRGR